MLVSLVVIDSLIVGAWFGFDEVIERMEGTALSKETRDEVNRDTLILVTDYPLLGSGAGSYYGVFPHYRQDDTYQYYDHAHNDYLQMLAEHGVVGVLPLFTLILFCLKNILQTLHQRRTLLFQSMAFGSLMSVMILSTVEFNLQIPAIAVTIVLVMSLAWVVRYMPSREKIGKIRH